MGKVKGRHVNITVESLFALKQHLYWLLMIS